MAYNISFIYEIINKFSAPLQKFQAATLKARRTVDKFAARGSAAFAKMGSRVGDLRNKMASLSLPIIGFGALMGRTALGFEKNMNAVEAASNASAKEMEALRASARKMGATTEFSASQAAGAQVELAKAGFNSVKILKTLPDVLSLASAGSLGMAEAAGIMTSTMAGFGLPAKEAARISDVLAMAAASAKTDVSQMGFALSKTASSAKAVGVPLETTVAILAALQDAGLEAGIAGTGLKGILLKMAAPAKEATKFLKQTGVSTKQLGEFMKKGDVVGLFEKLRANGISAGQAAKIFGLETANAALNFAASVPKIKKLNIALLNSAGAAKKMADIKMKGLPGAIKKLASAFESLILTLGEKGGFNDLIIKTAGFLIGLIDKLNAMNPNIIKLGTGLGLAVVALVPLLTGLKIGIALFSTIFPLIKIITIAFSAFVSVLSLPATIIAALVTGFGYLFLSFDSMEERQKAFIGFFKDIWFWAKKVFSLFTADIPFLDKLGNFADIVVPKLGLDKLLSKPDVIEPRVPGKGVGEIGKSEVGVSGKIDVTASGGAKVNSAEIKNTGKGNLGMNLAGGMP